MIENGQLAPAFAAKTFAGEDFDLMAYRGKKVWLGFYRWATCPLCNLRISEIIEEHHRFADKDIRHVAVFQSTAERIADGVATQNPPFPIIADPDMRLYETYGVYTSTLGLFYPRVFMRAVRATLKGFLKLDLGDGPKARIPADFLLDPEGLVWKAYYGQAASDHIDFDSVLEFADDDCLDMPDRSMV